MENAEIRVSADVGSCLSEQESFGVRRNVNKEQNFWIRLYLDRAKREQMLLINLLDTDEVVEWKIVIWWKEL